MGGPAADVRIVGRGFSTPNVHTTRKSVTWEGLAMRQELPGISHRLINGSVVPIAYNNLSYQYQPGVELTATIIKADIGGVGGHVLVHPHVMQEVAAKVFEKSKGLVASFFVSGAGDDISINLVHQKGINSGDIHKLCYDALKDAVPTSRALALYGPGQDLPDAGKTKFERTGNVQGAGPSVAELNLDSKHAQSQVIFVWSDKTDPGSYSIPLWNVYGQIGMQDSEMLAFSNARFGWWIVVQDVELKDAARELGKTPAEVDAMGSGLMMLHSGTDNRVLSTVLCDRDRYAIKGIFGTDEHGQPTRQVVSVSTDKLHNISGKYEGKDDPVMLMLAQKDYPAPGEIIRAGWTEPFLVAGNCRGSHHAVLMPAALFADTAYSSNPVVTSATVSIDYNTGYIGGMIDNFFGPAWDFIRQQATMYDLWFHRAHRNFQPKVLGKGALEYQIGFMEALAKANQVRRYFDLSSMTLGQAVRDLQPLTLTMRGGAAPAAQEGGREID